MNLDDLERLVTNSMVTKGPWVQSGWDVGTGEDDDQFVGHGNFDSGADAAAVVAAFNALPKLLAFVRAYDAMIRAPMNDYDAPRRLREAREALNEPGE